MSFLERYLQGECEQVWNDLQALGHTVRDEPVVAQAEAVAAETMRRVRRNCATLVDGLTGMGYVFGTYPDRSLRSPVVEPITAPNEQLGADLAELEATVGPLPLSLVAFWEHVGAVDFVGMHPAWGDGLDPVVVDPPEGVLAWLLDDVDEDESGVADTRRFGALAPDDLHKDNVSGGDPYGVLLPEPSADFTFVNEGRNLHFVPYLRVALLERGGLPGRPDDRSPLESVDVLTDGLEPF